MTPSDKRPIREADGDTATVLEDTDAHERTGFRVDDSINTGSSMDNSTDPLAQNMDYDRKKSPGT
jgi:hypothetical protein